MSEISDYFYVVVGIVGIIGFLVIPIYNAMREGTKKDARLIVLSLFTMLFGTYLLANISLLYESLQSKGYITVKLPDIITVIVVIIIGFVVGYLWWRVCNRCGLVRCTWEDWEEFEEKYVGEMIGGSYTMQKRYCLHCKAVQKRFPPG